MSAITAPIHETSTSDAKDNTNPVSISGIVAKYAKLSRQLLDANNSNTTLQMNLDGLKDDVNTLQLKLQTLQAKKSRAPEPDAMSSELQIGKNEACEATQCSAKKSLNRNAQRSMKLRAQRKELEARVQQLEDEIKTRNSKIDFLEEEVSELEELVNQICDKVHSIEEKRAVDRDRMRKLAQQQIKIANQADNYFKKMKLAEDENKVLKKKVKEAKEEVEEAKEEVKEVKSKAEEDVATATEEFRKEQVRHGLTALRSVAGTTEDSPCFTEVVQLTQKLVFQDTEGFLNAKEKLEEVSREYNKLTNAYNLTAKLYADNYALLLCLRKEYNIDLSLEESLLIDLKEKHRITFGSDPRDWLVAGVVDACFIEDVDVFDVADCIKKFMEGTYVNSRC